jgi:hypothetical protein
LYLSYKLSDSNSNFDGRIDDAVNIYVGIGFLALFLNYLLNVCLNTAAERQIKRIRYLFEFNIKGNGR